VPSVVLWPSTPNAACLLGNAAQLMPAWNASASAAWVELSADSGVTPDLITVSFDETGLAPGRYRGTITFTSDAVPDTSKTVEVEASIPGATPTCNGDCNDDGNVTVDELIKGVNIALGTEGIDQCASFDTNESGTVTVEELIRAVNNALAGF